MKKVLVTISVLVFSSALSLQAHAGIHDPRVNHRQHNQKLRIAQGVKSGELTQSEAKDLHGDQKEIRTEEKEFKSDGKLTKAERLKLHQDQNSASKEIYQDKHNAQERSPAN
jgi:Skp family chaperone for outer membrane proteins